MSPHLALTLSAPLGVSLNVATARMQHIANLLQIQVEVTFNGKKLVAEPNGSAQSLIDFYNRR